LPVRCTAYATGLFRHDRMLVLARRVGNGMDEAETNIPARHKSKLTEYYGIGTWAFLGLACIYALTLRVLLARQLPLWIDESWTALLSSAPSLQSFVHQMWLDSNAPLYYFVVWLWPFESDFGLRIPSILFLLISAGGVVRWAPLGRERRLFWAALLILWPEGISLFQDARYYALLYLLATFQVIAYLALIREPTLRRACMWTGVSTLAILTHYYAAILAVFQGLYYAWRHRSRAIETWPALLLTIPAFGWLAYHWPRLKLYGTVGTSWYPTLEPLEALRLLAFPVGGWLVVVASVLLSNRKPTFAVLVTAAASVILLLCVGLALPVLTARYLIPIVPSLLFCVAASVRSVGFLPVAALLFLPASGFTAWSVLLNQRANFGLERAAEMVPPKSTVTWWIDYPGSKIHDKPQMEAMLADAFARADVELRQARWGTDFQAGDAAIIIYQDDVNRTVKAPKNWTCNALTGWAHATLACHAPPPTSGG